MILVLRTQIEPPPKQDWVNPDFKIREEFYPIFQAIINWFCLSNKLRTERSCVIFCNDIQINIVGHEVRYLAPSLRSVASLLRKAYLSSVNLKKGETKESTPGIWVSKEKNFDFLEPHYSINPSRISDNYRIKEGTIFSWKRPKSIPLNLHGDNISFQVNWFNFSPK